MWSCLCLRLRPVAIYMILLNLCACVASAPEDVEFASVRAVDQFSQPEIKIVSMEDIFRHQFGINEGDAKQRPHKLLLKIYFSTETDLWEFTQGRGYDLGALAHFCDAPDKKVLLSFIDVYWNRRSVDSLRRNLIQQSIEAENGQRIEYYTFAEVKRDEPDPEFVSFDLSRDPRDLCIYLTGTNGVFAFRSNTFVVPKEEIAAALRELPPYFRDQGPRSEAPEGAKSGS